MPVILLVRHGQASADADDYDVLSDLGRVQAAVVGGELRRRALRDPLVVAGSLVRQQDTARLALPDAELRTDERWNEYDHVRLLREHGDPGEYDGTRRGIQHAMDHALARWIAAGDAGGWPAFEARTWAALDGVVAARRDAVVVTSGGVIATLAARLLSAGPGAVVPLNRVAVNAGITKITAGRSTTLICFNDHAHVDSDRRDLLTYR